MTAYFRSSGNPNDLHLLPKWLRSDEDVVNICAEAEARTIQEYTKSTFDSPAYRDRVEDAQFTHGFTTSEFSDATQVADGVFVCLKGYQADADHADVTAAFKTAMRREIAAVARWLAAQWQSLGSKNPLLASDSKEGSGVSYRKDAEDRVPPGFGAELRAYDVRPPYGGL